MEKTRVNQISAVANLNGMQCMMLRWEEFHALNAAHVIRLGKFYDPTQLQRTVSQKCEELGLSQLEFLPCRRKVRFVQAPTDASSPLLFQHLARAGRIETVLQQLLDDELNTPFPTGIHWPIRFTLIENDNEQYLLLTYQHAISDSRGMTLILREIVRALDDKEPLITKLDLSPPPISKLVSNRFKWSSLKERVLATAGEVVSSFSCYQLPSKFDTDLHVQAGLQVDGLSTERLKQTSRSLGVKVQDLLFASLLEAVSLNFGGELAHSRRKGLAVYAPADIRRDSTINTDAMLGQILGSITVREKMGGRRSFSELVRSVAHQTAALKKGNGHLDHSLHMHVMSRIWDLLPRRLNRVAGPYLIPLAGYISNVNLTEYLADEISSGTVRDYYRYSATGLLSPMMLGITTFGPTFNLTTTFHQDLFTREEIARIVSHVQMRILGQAEHAGIRGAFTNASRASGRRLVRIG